MKLEDDAVTLLAELRERGVPVGIVTNGSVAQWDKLHHMRLHDVTDCIVVSADHGADKPEPSIFLAAAQRLGVSPESILFVGDHVENDVLGAQAVGMHAAWIRRGREWPADVHGQPDFVIDRLSELSAVIATVATA
jgi:putative hydrolase of the HAD superfamily